MDHGKRTKIRYNRIKSKEKLSEKENHGSDIKKQKFYKRTKFTEEFILGSC